MIAIAVLQKFEYFEFTDHVFVSNTLAGQLAIVSFLLFSELFEFSVLLGQLRVGVQTLYA
jgi:hypothetical protein